MKFPQYWCDMFLPLGSCNQSCCRVLNSLNLGDLFIWKPIQQAVTLVECRCNQGMGEFFRGCIVKISSNLPNTFQRGQDISLVLYQDQGLKTQALRLIYQW